MGAKLTTSFIKQEVSTRFFLDYLCVMRIFVIDAGNTALKLGHFENGELGMVQRFAYDDLESVLQTIAQFKDARVVISSVVATEISQRFLDQFDSVLINSESKLPIPNAYATPHSLGIDRLCNAVASAHLMKTEYAVSIDIGTCIKFDLVSKTEGYLGGSISPGIDLRYRSLNDYTEKLPLLSNKNHVDYVGKDTETSIRSGVINGINAEIAGFVSYYESHFPSLTFFMTGGDGSNFDIQSKNDIFAVENLTLLGLFEIYTHNA